MDNFIVLKNNLALYQIKVFSSLLKNSYEQLNKKESFSIPLSKLKSEIGFPGDLQDLHKCILGIMFSVIKYISIKENQCLMSTRNKLMAS